MTTSEPEETEPQPVDDATTRADDPAVDGTDAGFPSSPEIDADDTDALSGEPGAAAG